jgi:mutator protein MutT
MHVRAPADTRPIAAAVAIVLRGDAVLLVSRANPPDAGRWAFPGGKIELGETIEAAAIRELREETGVVARADEAISAFDVFDRGADGVVRRHFVLVAVLCTWLSGEPVGADDAADACWFELEEVCSGSLDLSTHVRPLIRLAQARTRSVAQRSD